MYHNTYLPEYISLGIVSPLYDETPKIVKTVPSSMGCTWGSLDIKIIVL